MPRTLINTGKNRSKLTDPTVKYVPIFRTTGAPPTDSTVGRSGGEAPTWLWGDSSRATGDAVVHNYAALGDYIVKWNIDPSVVTYIDFNGDALTDFYTSDEWVGLTTLYVYDNPSLVSFNTYNTWVDLINFYCYDCGLTSLDTYATWIDLEILICGSNPLGSLDTFNTWTKLTTFTCVDCGLASLDTYDTWTALEVFSCSENNLVALNTYATWTNIQGFYCAENKLTDVDVFAAWTAIISVHVNDNLLTAAAIDDILVALDATGAVNGFLRYENNPGSADLDRSPAGAAAKASLSGKGWGITN